MKELQEKIDLIKYIVNREYNIDDPYMRQSIILSLIGSVLAGYVCDINDVDKIINE